MILLYPMSETDFLGFIDYFVKDYAVEIATNYRLPHEGALAQAKSEIAINLPEGEKTEGHSLKCIVNKENGIEHHIGYLWYRADVGNKSAFIYDFYLLPAFRNKGLGSRTMKSLEILLVAEGIRQIKLRVAAENTQAKKIYEKNGYELTGYNMNKFI